MDNTLDLNETNKIYVIKPDFITQWFVFKYNIKLLNKINTINKQVINKENI